LIIHRGSFDFTQLKGWHDKLLPVLASRADVVSLDIDETRNQVAIGIESPAATGEIKSDVAALQIPDAAVHVKVRARPVPRLTLQQKRRPVLAGFQIQNDRGGTCTLGLNARVNGQRVFVTASHCSGDPFSNPDNRPIYQPTVSGANEIGHEIMDWPGFRCFWAFRCRYSDAAIFEYNGSVSDDFEKIARTESWAEGGRGSIVLSSSQPTFTIVEKVADGTIHVGERVHKVGRTSGWTTGLITETCVSRIGGAIFLCQYVAELWSEGGDSGAPVFQHYWKGSAAHAHGILWGGPPGDWTETWYSPLSGVETDLGVQVDICYGNPFNGCPFN
ncbi:MAG: hypothetical protein V3U13_11225, partial [Gemmatimonadota bacterium]